MKKIFFLTLIGFYIFGLSSIYANATEKLDEDMSVEELREYYDTKNMAIEYGVEEDVLLKNIYEGIYTNSFHPFLNIPSSDNSTQNYSILIKFPRTVASYNQDSTMYLETGNPCASGVYPYLGCVAVHRKSTTDYSPVIPFGTTINYLSDSVNINGRNFESFTVEDTGDKDYVRSTYWTDVYGGANTSANRTMAWNYGVKKVDISW